MVKVFLAGIESSPEIWDGYPYMLCSFMYARRLGDEFWDLAKGFKELMTDSGAHTYHAYAGVNGVRKHAKMKAPPDPIDYTNAYCEWIKRHRNTISTVVELDIDSVVGWEKQLEIRNVFESHGVHALPVYHLSQPCSFEDYCRRYDFVSVNRGENTLNKIKKYLAIAQKYKTDVHVFGYTRTREMKELVYFPSLYSVDSSTWLDGPKYGIAFSFEGNDIRYMYTEQWRRKFGNPDKQYFNDLTDKEKNIFNMRAWKQYAEYLAKLKGEAVFQRRFT